MTRDEQILATAARLFYERGFHGVGVDEIGRESGVTGPAIYRHFRSKDELLVTLLDRAYDRMMSEVGGPLEDPFEELEHLLRAHASRAVETPEIVGVHAHEVSALAPSFRRRIERREREYIERWTGCLARCWPGRPERELAQATWSIIGVLGSVAFWPRDLVEGHGFVDLLVSLLDSALARLTDDDSEPSTG